MVDYMLDPDEFPQILACAWCEKPHLDCDGFVSNKLYIHAFVSKDDVFLSFCSENCVDKYDNEEEDC